MAVTVQPPESATWRVHLDRSMWVGGVRSLMLQALHPRAMWGVWQNSVFQNDPIGRLQRTAHFVGTSTFGSPEEMDRLAARVRKIHAKLRFVNPDTGETERLDAPDLLLWVHCAEVYSYLVVARRAGLPLTDAMADQYLREQRKSAVYVGLKAEDVPGSVEEMEDYFARVRPQLRVTDEARETVKFLLWPKLPGNMRFLSPGKPAYLPFGMLCYYTLPDWAREMYGLLPEVPQSTVTAALRSFRLAMNTLPERLHDFSFHKDTRQMLERARQSLAAEGYDMSKGLFGLRDPRRWPSRRGAPVSA
ncbi:MULTISPECIES: oxygenase MpaB family protein [Thermomonospora]|uniref:ER-bound oxygenase mpaB/mpaB'/Rubber oxygenase catalytic domain-containing protein n=1 Tax=Thermomonospora curvata (strain ATCC 19995 / DSM 43183 / JCM 3096 / KCTC 9072 / NBRC 15933 / NCIMB 10081 / Henssen B9) TaxID=471852 RepID=D1A985_THECD|nr:MULTISPECIES: oxygenase MpaB family protein [Thermomonospora]ACY96781.1 conserved hypothetical protein [Thermomonospora curvata DSM 43183]PKK15324.1 MAG: DUF2236 domain-containing protein [Thermomonospora sp. CIF 1]